MEAVIALSVMGAILSVMLGIASKVFEVEVNPKVEQVVESLPGANCGACGYPGCSGYAKAVCSDEAVPTNLCAPGGEEVAKQISNIVGRKAEVRERSRAFVLCSDREGKVGTLFQYDGILDCKASVLLFGGGKACQYGCLGFGTCCKVCPFGAISIDGGTPKIDEALCTGCGRCVNACPKKLIRLISTEVKVLVACSSREVGGRVRKICPSGCIGCKRCVKACKEGAVKVEGNLAEIDYKKCKECFSCVSECPTGAILKIGG
jgi:electron transport complex protein RnfB